VAPVGESGALWAERFASIDVAALAERTARAAPARHPRYSGLDYFDPATETPPALDADGQ